MDPIANVTRQQLEMTARFQVRMAYRAYLFRDPSEDEFVYWVGAIVDQGLPIPQAESMIRNSPEAAQAQAELQAQRQAEIEAARLEVARARGAADAAAEAARMKALFDEAAAAEAAQREAEAMARAAVEAERAAAQLAITQSVQQQLQAEQAALLDRRAAVVDAGAANADQDFLMQQASIDEAAAMQADALMQAQASLDQSSGSAAAAYAVEVRANVVDVYRQILRREPAAYEIDYWTGLVIDGAIQDELIPVRLSQSTEALILGAYQQNLYRDPSLEERRYWCDAVEIHGLAIDQALASIANSPEAQQYHETIVPTPGASELIVQTINPMSGSAAAINPMMGTSTWGASYTNQDMIAADPQADPTIELQNYYNPVVNVSDLEAVSPLGNTSAALAFKARDEIYKAYTVSLKREPTEADYQYWEPQLVNKALSLDNFKRYVATSDEAQAIIKRAGAVSLTTTTPEGVQDAAKKTEGVGAAVGLLSAIAFFLGQ